MLVLVLAPQPALISATLAKAGDTFLSTTDKIDAAFVAEHRFDFLISYGYRYIIQQDVLELMAGKNCNMHVSYLPWNRGADPNFWSFVDDTPKGVSIHVMDKALDTGPILCQEEVSFDDDATLRSSYSELHKAMVGLFEASWNKIRDGRLTSTAQPAGGSYHRTSDKSELWERLALGFDTPVNSVREQARAG